MPQFTITKDEYNEAMQYRVQKHKEYIGAIIERIFNAHESARTKQEEHNDKLKNTPKWRMAYWKLLFSACEHRRYFLPENEIIALNNFCQELWSEQNIFSMPSVNGYYNDVLDDMQYYNPLMNDLHHSIRKLNRFLRYQRDVDFWPKDEASFTKEEWTERTIGGNGLRTY